MIQIYSRVKVTDNSGARVISCIGVPGGSGRKYAHAGDIIVASVKQATASSQIKSGEIVKAVIVRTTKQIRRKALDKKRGLPPISLSCIGIFVYFHLIQKKN